MVQFDNQYRQIKIKIVYYGPALGGKTTCLQKVHHATDPNRRTKLYSLNTASDRTLFFDLMSLNLGRIRGYQLALQLYTVPGQVQYDATRRAVLSGADGVVFVADSQAHCRDANIESLDNLWTNLAANGLDRKVMPLIFQYNKRDLDPLLSVEELDEALNPNRLPAVLTVAVRGEGVMEGFSTIAEKTLAAVADKLGVGSSPTAIKRLQDQVRAALAPYMPEDGVVQEGAAVTIPGGVKTAEGALPQDVLVGEAVRANMAMTDLTAQLETLSKTLDRQLERMAGVHDFGSRISAEHDQLAILRQLLTTATTLLQVPAGAVLMVPGSGEMREIAVHGIGQDPLLHTHDEVGEPVALKVLADPRPMVLSGADNDGTDPMLAAAIEGAGFSSGLTVPLVVQERILGLLSLFADARRGDFDEHDLRLASVLGATGAIACANARSWQELEDLNRSLEGQVEARTRELRKSLSEVQRMASDLEEKNAVIDSAYRDLAELDRIKDELLSRLADALKNPVSSVTTAAAILENYQSSLPEKGARFVTIIRDEAGKLAEIIENVFQASVLAGSQRRPNKEGVPLSELFKKAIMPLRDLAHERNVRLKVLIPSGLETLYCDRGSMEVALRAICKNAVVYNNADGEVKITVHRLVKGGHPWLSLAVSDTGPGIPEDELPHVFETFWSGSNSKTAAHQGVGLGLSIAKMVAEKHGGSIDITSSSTGTQVSISLPQEE